MNYPNCLKMKKVRSRWVSHQLTNEKRVELCRENLAKFQNASWRLCDIITGDKRWIYHRPIHHKWRNLSCLGEGHSSTTVIRRSKEGKNFFSIFFKWNNPVFLHCVDEGKTRDENYSIENCLKPVVKQIWKQEVWGWLRRMLEPIFIVTFLIL